MYDCRSNYIVNNMSNYVQICINYFTRINLMNVFSVFSLFSIVQVRLPGALVKFDFLPGAERSSPGVLPLLGVAPSGVRARPAQQRLGAPVRRRPRLEQGRGHSGRETAAAGKTAS